LSPLGVGRQKRPKSAVLARDTPGLGDSSLTALHMATCLSQLEHLSPEHGGNSQKTPLHQTQSPLEPPPQPCREVPRDTALRWARGHGPHGQGAASGLAVTLPPSEWSRSAGGCLDHLGLQQDTEGLQEHGWHHRDHPEIFRYPQALELGRGDMVQASSCGPMVPGRALRPGGEER
ncbi:hypothetical protein N321_09082, partial [Antrostomus carolinensis]